MFKYILIAVIFISTELFAQLTTSFDGKQVYLYRVHNGNELYARRSSENWVKVTTKGLPGSKIEDIAAAYTDKEKTTFVYAIAGNRLYSRRSGNDWRKLTTKGLPAGFNPKHISCRYTEEEKVVFLYLELEDGRMYARRSGGTWNKLPDLKSGSRF